MFIRNLLHPMLVNGNLFMVMRMDQYKKLVARHDADGDVIETVVLNRTKFEFSFADNPMIRRQFPTRLSFAAKVHKRQEKTLNKLVEDVRSNFVCAEQIYVRLSRVRKAPDVVLLHKDLRTPEHPHAIHPMLEPETNPVLHEPIAFCNPSFSYTTWIYDRFEISSMFFPAFCVLNSFFLPQPPPPLLERSAKRSLQLKRAFYLVPSQ